MKKKNSLKTILLVLTVFAGFAAFANLPELSSLTSVDPSDLPDTASYSDGDVYLDMDDDGDIDFVVDHYRYTGSGGYTRYRIYNWNSSGSVLIDETMVPPSPALNASAYVSNIDISVFAQGESIESTEPDGSVWNDYGEIFRIYDTAPTSALQSTFYDSSEGYVGIRYDDGDGYLYGWIHLKVDEAKNEVIVLSAGSSSVVDKAIAAGDGDPYGVGFIVPVPFIASFLGLAFIGITGFIRKRRKRK